MNELHLSDVVSLFDHNKTTTSETLESAKLEYKAILYSTVA